MLFNTFQFAVFYVVVLAAFFALPHRWRWAFLLAASYYFYMCWNAKYLVVIVAITLIDYCAAIQIQSAPTARRKKCFLWLSLSSNFGVLFLFKYLDFATGSLQAALGAFNLFPDLPRYQFLLPVGISFHTFQAVSYIVEVYWGKTRAEKHLGIYALYVAFFPQMVAGPIERSQNLLPQLRRRTRLDFQRTRSGLEMVLWGLFKKVVLADLLAVLVNKVYAHPQSFSGFMLTLATIFFALQIYCDFSGYSEMAVGLARIMGYDLMTNFRSPYFSQSVAEFWRRWHISLSSWFRDYVYIPLGGNRVSGWRWMTNVLLVFLLSGLWHGANLTFVIWGALHGVYVIAGALSARVRTRVQAALGLALWPRTMAAARIMTTFTLVLLAWVFFRAKSPADALYVLSHFYRFAGFQMENLFRAGLPRFEIALAVAVTGVVLLVELIRAGRVAPVHRLWNGRIFRWPAYCACLYGIVFFGVFEWVEFIYFQF